MIAIRLRTEYLRDPLGIDIVRPRLSWNCRDGIRQNAYRLLCRDDEGKVLWDSGKRKSSAMHARYSGEALTSRSRVVWQVKLWDEQDAEGEWSEEASFELGLLAAEDWQAAWISGDYRVNPRKRYPIDCFRKEVRLEKPLRKARLYITACGIYEACINGQKAGDFCLAPGITDYRKRVQYQVYDVTGLLKDGENELTVQLADGWYRGSVGAWGIKNAYGTETKLLAQLEIGYEDGSSETVATDSSWQWSNDGPIRFADNKDGEIVEAFRTPSYGGQAKLTTHPVVPSASDNVPVTEHEHFSAVMTEAPNGRKLLDFGQNIAGYLAFRLEAREGQRIFIRFGEMLDAEGNLTLQNIQCVRKNMLTPLQQVDYICREGLNEYKTRFAVFGFQYAEVETDGEIKAEDFTAIAVCSDMEETGSFESSNELLNRFVDATRWSTKNNSLDLPTDCPTRERHGWTGDAQIFFNTAAYLFDYAAFSKKFLNDMYDWQRKDGCLPQIAPYGGVNFYMNPMNGSVGWADAGILIPYRFFKIYGDRRILKKYYAGMKRFARFMIRRCGKWGGVLAKPVRLSPENRRYLVNVGQSYGEWAEPEDVHPYDWRDMAAPHPEVSTAYTAYVLGLMAEIAGELGKEKDAGIFRKYSEGCRKAYQEMSELPEFSLDTDVQARLVRPLAFGLLSEEQTAYARKRLLEALEHYGWRLGTGFLSTPLILDVLLAYDTDAAYRLLENEEMPGWLFMPKNGATTIWESWEGTLAQGGIASLDHYSKGAVVEWLFTAMCGIRPDGENHFVIAPVPGGHFTHAKAAYRSRFGLVESGWERADGKTVYTVTVPANCSALLRLPGREAETVGAGSYRFETV